MLTTSRKVARGCARLPADARTCVAASRTCVQLAERKGRFVFRFEYDSTRRIFQDKRSISRFRFLYRRRLARIAYACLFAGRSVAVDASRRDARIADTRGYFCLARRHVCPVSGVFR